MVRHLVFVKSPNDGTIAVRGKGFLEVVIGDT